MRNSERKKSKINIGIKYCGGCNPQISRSKIIKKLRGEIDIRKYGVTFVSNATEDNDAIIIINGCARACVNRQDMCIKAPKCIIVRGEMVDSEHVAEDNIPGILLRKIEL